MSSRRVAFSVLALLVTCTLLAGLNVTRAMAVSQLAARGGQTLPVVDDFEDGLPAGWFQYGDYGSGVVITTEIVSDDSRPGLPVGNQVLEIAYTSAGWGAGTGRNLNNQDWSAYGGLSFWFYGVNSGSVYRVILSDNLNPSLPGDTAERFAYEFNDNAEGWRLISIPWTDFFRDPIYQPPGAPNDGLTLTEMQAYALALPAGTRTLRLDQVALFGQGQVEIKVAYTSSSYRTVEGSSAAITVTLNTVATMPVTVTYATADDSAVAGVDYIAAFGQLLFAQGTTQQSFTLHTLDNTTDEGERTVLLDLSDPVNAVLGPRSHATLTIADNDTGATGGCCTRVIDDFEEGQLSAGEDPNGLGVGFVTWNAAGAGVSITTTVTPPAAVPGAAAGNRVLREGLSIGAGQWAGFTHAFSNAALTEWVSQDWSSYEGLSLWLYGNNSGGTLFIDVLDNRNPGSTRDDAERWSVDIPDTFSGWHYFEIPWSDFHRKDIGNGAPNDGFTLTEVHGYGIGGYGNVPMGNQAYYVDQVVIFGDTGTAQPPLKVEFAAASYTVDEGSTAVITVTLNITSAMPVAITYTTAEGYATPERDYRVSAGVLVIEPGQLMASFPVITLPDAKAEGNERLMLNLHDPVNAEAGFQMQAMLTIRDNQQPDPALLDDFEGFHRFTQSDNAALSTVEIAEDTAMALPGQGAYEQVLSVAYGAAGSTAPSFSRIFPAAQDWRGYGGLQMWYYGNNSGQTVTLHLLDNQTTTTAQTPAADWQLVWSDDFSAGAGSAPNPNVWSAEIGDGTLNGIPGWGNSELEYYTENANAATDGNGNLVITLEQVQPDSHLLCWYGPCEYTSARLISANKIEAEYGRIEARIRVPDGAAGLWPAFWMLGANINQVGWPQSGEIDIMEYVSRNPYEVFGTIHGPGYSGGSAIGHTYTFPQPVAAGYHTFAIEWSPGELHWFVDDINYHNVTAADVAPREWVFNHPFYLLLNMAIGGNFGGTVSPDLTFPQQMLVDYVRVYQAPNSSERFQATFSDDFSGWRKITVPFSAFTRSGTQPAGAPNDGLSLDQIWGYGMSLPAGSSGTLYLDQVRLAQVPAIHRSRRFNVNEDTFLNGAQPSVAYGNAQTLWLGFFDLMRPLLRAPINGIPVDAQVDAAYLYLYVTEGRGFSNWANSVIDTVSVHSAATPWQAASTTWSAPWSMTGGDYGPALSITHLGLGKLNTWLRLDVTDAVQAVVNGQANYGFILASNEDHGVRYAFASQNYWDPARIGYVRVYYRTLE